MPREYALELKTTQSHSPESNMAIEFSLDSTMFSTLSRLIGVTARVLQAVRKFKNLNRRETINPPVDIVEESLRAELLWVKIAQREISDQTIQSFQG